MPPPAPDAPPPRFDAHLVGTVYGLFSAFTYTCANSFLRAVNDCDPVWVSAIRALPTVVILGPVLLVMAARGQRLLPSAKFAGLILIGGLCGQLGGNICFQSALSIIGVALAVPLTTGGMIVAAAILGRVFLAEPLTPRALVAICVLLAAIGVLALGAEDAGRAMATAGELSPWTLAGGVAAGCGAGVFYSILNAILRYCVVRGSPLPTSLFLVSATGVVTLGCLAWLRIGPAGMLATTPADLTIMLAAGVCNTVAFLALTKSLQLNSIVYVNALNATQATLAALAGVLIFGEQLSPWLVLGIGLTVVGLMALARAHRAMRALQ